MTGYTFSKKHGAMALALWADRSHLDRETIEEECDRFLDEARFAKIVRTQDGDALLIGGEVINIKSSAPRFHAEALCQVLRGILVSTQ